MGSADTETVVEAATGGKKGQKACRLSSAPPAGIEALGRVCGMGADKYELHNYRKGYAWSLNLDALQRHYWAFVGGEDVDPQSGEPHMAHVAWHALTLVQFMQDHRELDDRFKAQAEKNGADLAVAIKLQGFPPLPPPMKDYPRVNARRSGW